MTSLTILKMQIKAAMRYHYSIRMAKMEKYNIKYW